MRTTDDNVSTTDDNVSTTDDNVSTTDDSVSTTDDSVSITDDNASTTDDNVSTTDDNVSTDDNTFTIYTPQDFCCTKQQIKIVIQKVHDLSLPLMVCNIIHLFLFVTLMNILYYTVIYETVYLWIAVLFGKFLEVTTIWYCTKIINIFLILIGLNEFCDLIKTMRCKLCYIYI